jgi:hypothetical protein
LDHVVGASDYLDVDPEGVAGAGRRTAATSSNWASWASRSESLLRDTASGARSATVTGAFEGYLSSWNPAMRSLAVRAENLGTNAVSGAAVVSGADNEGAAVLGSQTAAGQAQTSYLSRPVNGSS